MGYSLNKGRIWAGMVVELRGLTLYRILTKIFISKAGRQCSAYVRMSRDVPEWLGTWGRGSGGRGPARRLWGRGPTPPLA